MDSRSTPGRVVSHHLENQHSEFLAGPLSTTSGSMPRQPGPVQPKAGAVPADDRFRGDNDQRLFPVPPQFSSQNPEEFIGSAKPGFRPPRLQHRELLTQSKILQEKIASGTQKPREREENEKGEPNLSGIAASGAVRKLLFSKGDRNYGERQRTQAANGSASAPGPDTMWWAWIAER